MAFLDIFRISSYSRNLSILLSRLEAMFGGRRGMAQPDAMALALKGIMYSCIDRRAKVIGATNYIVSRRRGDKIEPVQQNHWLVRLLRNPSAYYTSDEIYKLAAKYYDISGEAFLWTRCDGERYPIDINTIPPATVDIILNSGGIECYRWWRGDGHVDIPPEEMLHLRRLEPVNNMGAGIIRGRGLVEAAIEAAQVGKETADYIRRFFANDASRPNILKAGNEKWDELKWNQYRDTWNEKLPNFKVKALLQGGLDFAATAAPSALTLDYNTISDQAKKEIAAIFGMSLGQLTGEFTSYATADAQNAVFIKQTIEPELRYFATVFTNHFRQFEPDIVVQHEPYLYVDPNEQRLQEEHDFSHGVLTVNDLRSKRGAKPVEGGDTPLLKSGYVSIDAALNPPAPSFFSLSPTQTKGLLIENKRVAYWRSYDNRAKRFASEIKSITAGVFGRLGEELTASAAKQMFVSRALSGDIFDEETWVQILAAAVQKPADAYLRQIVRAALADTGKTTSDLPTSFDNVLKKMLEKSTSKITTAVGTIKAELEAMLQDAAPDSTPAELSAMIQGKFTQYTTSGADRIARTTATFTTGAAQQETWKNVGIAYEWLTEQDAKVRPTHQIADGQTPNEDGMFAVGYDMMTHPGAGALAEENVNCRCTLFPRTS